MKKRTQFFFAVGLIVSTLLCFACSKSNSTVAYNPSATVHPSGQLKYKVPDGWISEKPSSGMRAAQYKLPKADGDPEDGSLILYFFGMTQGGSVQANIDRWVGQMQQPDGSSSKDKAKTENITVNGLKVTTVDLTGTYTAEMMPGAGERHNNAEYRLRAAVIETPKGNYFAKLVGPAKTLARWDQAFMDYLRSFEFN